MLESEATYDRLSVISTAVFMVLYVECMMLVAIFLDTEILAVKIALLIIIPLILILATIFAPSRFILTDDMLVVKGLVGSVKVPYVEISEAQFKPEEWSLWKLRFCSSFGYLGWWGPSWDRKYGKFSMYVTNGHNLVVVKTKVGKMYWISPSRPEEFVGKLNEARKR